MRNYRAHWLGMATTNMLGLLLLGCSGGARKEAIRATETAAAFETEQASAEPTKLPGTTDYGIPSQVAAVVNPIAADEASLVRGQEIFESICIECHGEHGDGNGPTASRLNPEPADYRAEHVRALSDGELFYIITNGLEGSAMVPFNYFDEDQRWHLVNYIRAFQE